jgi:protein arginine kinase activator
MIDKVCPVCRTALSKFYKTGMLGCPACYEVFYSEIAKTIEQVQEGFYHQGKIPKLTEEDRELLEEYKLKALEKEKAVIEGRFEDATEINKDVYYLAKELKKRGLL